ncbi:MAG: hypothetical protein WBG38_13845 [Nodosilinea sp.]
MTILFPLKLRAGKRSLRWSGGGLLALVSIGLHGLLLGMPLSESTPEPQSDLTELSDPAAVIDVVRLPAPSVSVAEVMPELPAAAPEPTASPSAAAPAPAAPTAPAAPLLPVPPPVTETTLEPVPPELPPATLDDRLRDPAQYQFNQQAKSLTADEISLYTNELSAWLEAESEGLSDDNAPELGTKLAPLQVVYPIATCLVPPPAEGLVGVIISTTGQLVQDPILLDSTGYTVLDEKALEIALQRRFEPQTGSRPNPKAYWLPVQVQYNGSNCQP